MSRGEYNLRPTLTKKRLQWLQLLLLGPRERGANRTGYDCMRLGWTEWNYRDQQGREMTAAEAKARFGDEYWMHCTMFGERLTPAGRKLAMNGDAR